MFDLSDTLIVYDPARRLVTFELPFFMPIVKPGPTVAFNVVAACATATEPPMASATTTGSAQRRRDMSRPPCVGTR